MNTFPAIYNNINDENIQKIFISILVLIISIYVIINNRRKLDKRKKIIKFVFKITKKNLKRLRDLPKFKVKSKKDKYFEKLDKINYINDNENEPISKRLRSKNKYNS